MIFYSRSCRGAHCTSGCFGSVNSLLKMNFVSVLQCSLKLEQHTNQDIASGRCDFSRAVMPKITVNGLFYNYTTQGFIPDSISVSKPRRSFCSAQRMRLLNTSIHLSIPMGQTGPYSAGKSSSGCSTSTFQRATKSQTKPASGYLLIIRT